MQIQHRHNVIYHSWSGDTIKSTKQMYINNPWNANSIITIRDHCIIISEYGNTKKLSKLVLLKNSQKCPEYLIKVKIGNSFAVLGYFHRESRLQYIMTLLFKDFVTYKQEKMHKYSTIKRVFCKVPQTWRPVYRYRFYRSSSDKSDQN